MTHFRTKTLSAIFALSTLSAVAFTAACSSDDDDSGSSGSDDAGAGGGMGTGGSGTGGSGTGGSGTGGSGTGGMGTGGMGTGGMGTGGMGTGGGTSDPDGGAAAKLRVVHASAGAPAVDIYPKGASTPVVEDLAYGEATDYLELPEGSYELDIRAAGSPATDAPVFTTPAVALAAGKQYTAVAAGDIASSADADKFRVLPYEEGFGADEAGKVRLRIIHASPDAPTVDLDVGNDDPADAEVKGFARFAETGAEGVALPAGAKLQVGIAAGGSTVTAFTTPELPDGGEAFVIAVGKLGKLPREADGFKLLAVLGGSTTAFLSQNPVVYALHASPDAPAVDIYAGEAEIVDNAAYGQMAGVQVPPGAYTLDFFAGAAGATPRPAGAPAATAATPELAAGERYLAIATGKLVDGSFQLIPLADGFALDDPTNARVRAVHASSNAPSVDIGTVTTAGTLDQPAVLSGVAFKADSGAAGLSLPATSLTLGFAGAGTTATAAEFDLTLAGGLRAFAVAAGDFGGSPNGFGLMVVNTGVSPWTVTAVAPK